MFELNKQAIEEVLRSMDREYGLNAKNLTSLDKKVSGLKQKIYKKEQRQNNLQYNARLLYGALVVLNHWPTEVMKLKEQITLLEKEAARGDILVLEQGRLQSEIARVNSEIAEKCQHPFVIGYRGSGGSQSWDYDDSYRGKRLCLVCGLEERSDSNRKGVYKILQESENRLIDDMKLDREKGYDDSQPLEEIIKSFISPRVYELQNASQ